MHSGKLRILRAIILIAFVRLDTRRNIFFRYTLASVGLVRSDKIVRACIFNRRNLEDRIFLRSRLLTLPFRFVRLARRSRSRTTDEGARRRFRREDRSPLVS